MKQYNIGYTTGVFDLFHIGHLNIIRKAKEQCKILIVGVSTDELVEKYKNKKPIIAFEERIEIIKSIKYVDQVVPQTNMNKLEAWKKYHFNAIFHGDDWKGTPLYDKYISEFSRVGVKIVFLPHTDGTSSTVLTNVLYDVMNKKSS